MTNIANFGYTGNVSNIMNEGVSMEKPAYKPLDLSRILKKEHITISTEEAMKDVTPLTWADELLENREIIILKEKSHKG